jgi:hypothetical protein
VEKNIGGNGHCKEIDIVACETSVMKKKMKKNEKILKK